LPAALSLAAMIAMPLAAAAFFDSSYTAPGVNYTVRGGTAYIGYNSGRRSTAVRSTSLGKNVGSFLGGPLGAIFKKENGREMVEGDVVTISEGEFLGWMEATGSAVFIDPLFMDVDAATARIILRNGCKIIFKNPSENGKTILQYYSDTPASFADLEKAFKNSGGKAEITADIKKLNDFIKSASPSAPLRRRRMSQSFIPKSIT